MAAARHPVLRFLLVAESGFTSTALSQLQFSASTHATRARQSEVRIVLKRSLGISDKRKTAQKNFANRRNQSEVRIVLKRSHGSSDKLKQREKLGKDQAA